MRIKNLRNIEDVLNYGLKILGKWSDDLLLKYNPNKTKSVFFFTKSKRNDCQLDTFSSHKLLAYYFLMI